MRNFLTVLIVVATVSCLSAQTFYRQYGNNLVDEGGQCVIASSDGNMFVGGFKDDSALVMKVDMLGNILWSRAFKPAAGYPTVVHQLGISPDGFLVGIGNDYDASVFRYRDGYFFKMDLAGNLIWLNRVSESREVHFESMHLFSTTQYRLFMTVYDVASPTFADPSSLLVDAVTGNVISTTPRNNLTAIAYLDDQIASTSNTAGNRFYGTGRIYVNGAIQTSMRVFLTKYDLAGTLLSTSYLMYTAAQSSRLYGSDITYNNDSIAIAYFGDISAASTNFTVGLIRCDTNGTIAWAKNYNITSSTSDVSYRVLSHAGGYFIMGSTLNGVNDFFMLSIDLGGNLLWSRSYGSPGSTENLRAGYTPCATIIGPNIYFTGQSNSSGTYNIVVASMDFSGNISCMAPPALAVTTANNPTNLTLLAPTTVAFATSYVPPLVAPIPQPLSDACSSVSLNLGNDTTVCGTLVLNATLPSASSYLWSDGSANATLNVTAPGTYWAMVYVNCCLYSDTIVVVSDTLPQANFSWTVAQCTSLVTFTDSSLYASSYFWDFGDNSTGTSASPVHLYSGSGPYNVIFIASNSCGSDTAFAIVNTPPPLNLSVNPANVVVCAGDSTLLNATAIGGSGPLSYLWNPIGVSNSTVMITPSVAGTYYVTVTDSLGCTDTDSVSVTISSPATLSATGFNTICFGQSTTISAAASNGGPYTWSNNLGTNSSVSVSPAVTTTYYVTVFDSCSGAVLIDSVTIVVMPPSVVAFSIDSSDGCAPLTVYFTDLSTTGQDQIVSWLWYFGDGDSSSAMSPVHTYTTPGSYTITLTVVTSSGCVTTLVNGAVIDVYPVPIAGFTWNQSGSIGDQPEVQFTDESVGASDWTWYFGDSATSNVSDPFHTYAQTGDFTVMQVVGNSYGCYDTAYANIELVGEFTIYVPNTFTPGSGIYNNTFGGIGTGIVEYHLMVFDRWGMLIFKSDDYNQQWDGTFKGNRVQEDTYVWVIDVIDFMGGEHHLIGHINVIR